MSTNAVVSCSTLFDPGYVVNSCDRSPTVTDQDGPHYVAPIVLVEFSVILASILPLVQLLLVLIVLGSVIQLPLVLSLAFGKSVDLFVHIFLKLHYWTLTLERVSEFHNHNREQNVYEVFIQWIFMDTPVNPTSRYSDSTFSGGGDDEGSVAANSVMPALADGDRGKQTPQSQMPLYSQLEGIGSSVGTVGGSTGARCSSSSSSFSTSSSSLSSSDDSLS
ncbi:hypothetical protein Tco_0085504 [Tanacetum coccineum]